MISYEEMRKSKEISKLIQYGYDLHKSDMKRNVYTIPNFEFYNGNSCPMKVMPNGGIFGIRNYPNHSQSYLCTTLGICVGKLGKDGFEFEYAQMFETSNDDFRIYFEKLRLSDDKNNWYQTLERDLENSWYEMSDEDKVDLFIKSMEFIGFRKEDVLAVINGNMTAREAYVNVAPDNIKTLQWVNKNRRYYVFDGNVAIEGDFSSMDMDDFPFPFDGQPILDCSKVKTYCIRFNSNRRRVKLINVNKNPFSIKYTDLKNAIIEEPIDLSKVNATGTRFGHHTVINLDYSITLDEMDLSLAVNGDGERYAVDENGVVQFEDFFTPKTIPISNAVDMKVLSNADNSDMTNLAFCNNADGIGLVRTEHIFKTAEDKKRMIELFVGDLIEEEVIQTLERLKKLQIQQAREILNNAKGNKVIFRLMDFKLKEYLKGSGLSCDLREKYLNLMRGSYLLCNDTTVLISQLEAIFEEVSKLNVEVNLLVPMIREITEFRRIKEEIMQVSQKYDLKSLKIGAMIENVEMANDADLLAKEVDFISIGTNDLTESVTGLSRDTNSIEFQELTEEVKSVIKEIIYRARASKADIVIGICGEHSNYIENVQFYNGIGANYIICSPDFVKVNREFLDANSRLHTSRVKHLTDKKC